MILGLNETKQQKTVFAYKGLTLAREGSGFALRPGKSLLSGIELHSLNITLRSPGNLCQLHLTADLGVLGAVQVSACA